MDPRWKLTLGLAGVALVAALVAPRLLPLWSPVAPAAVTVAADPVTAVAEPVAEPEPEPRVVDLVICLDTSGSMGSLIDSARARLWDIVNGIDAIDRDAEVRVGLITYGSPGVAPAEAGFVKVQQDLTTDLDAVYAKAWEMQTAGGDEYVGWALHTALEEMSWTEAEDAFHFVYIAGNEDANQGAQFHSFVDATARAVGEGVRVSTLYAGNHDVGIREGWKAVADAGRGDYFAIDATRSAVSVATPWDDELNQLNQALNDTYVPVGRLGAQKKAALEAADRKAVQIGSGSAASRLATKGSSKYKVATWDLVEAVAEKNVELGNIADDQLPEELRGKSLAEKEKAVAEKEAERKALKARIAAVSAKRGEFLDEQRAEADESGLDGAMLESLGYLMKE